MRLPSIPTPKATMQVAREFRGINRDLLVADGEWNEEKNLTAEQFPVFSTRSRRSYGAAIAEPGGVITKDAMAWVDGHDLYYGEERIVGLVLSKGEKQLISMGAYLLIWPDKVWFNTEWEGGDEDRWGYMEQENPTTSPITAYLCRADGGKYGDITQSAEAPQKPEDGQLWMDTSGKTPALRQWAENSASWISIATVYVRLESTNIGLGLKQWDGVIIEGLTGDLEGLNGSHVLQAAERNAITIIGIFSGTDNTQTESATVRRSVPEMDFVTECDNRIWGCKYGLVNGKVVNEIYASKLGDFKNWNCFQGLSTDSYVASRGSDGVFTGATTHLGHPLFFKEDYIEKVYPAANGAHQIVTTEGRGVQKGCHRSLQVVDETLYYKSRKDICAYTGALPVSVSGALGDVMYSDARAGSVGQKYYISMKDAQENWHMLCYDTGRNIWHEEDDTQAMMFTTKDGELWWIDEKLGRLVSAAEDAADEREGAFDWFAESGNIGLGTVEQKYLARFVIRAELEEGTKLKLFLKYDDGGWIRWGDYNKPGLYSFVVPVSARRCDHARLRIEGSGGCRIYSISRLMEKGSDVTC